MLEAIEFMVLIGWGILMIGFVRKDYTITSLAAIFIMIIGTSILTKAEGTLINIGFGAVHIAIGFYVLVRSGTETYKGKSFKKPEFIKTKKETEEEENGIQEE